MKLQTTEADFQAGLERGHDVLWANGNPGRMAAIGRGAGEFEDNLIFVNVAGGRSEGSRTRRAIPEGSTVRLIVPGMTAEEMATNPKAPLVYYHQSDSRGGVFVGSNGAQTPHVLDGVLAGESLDEAVRNAPVVRCVVDGEEKKYDLSEYEPDPPIYTPRISTVIDVRPEAVTQFGLAIARKDGDTWDTTYDDWTTHLDEVLPGQGWAIQTYDVNDPDDNISPVPHFVEAPYAFDFSGDPEEIAARVRTAIGERTFAAAVVRVIDVNQPQFAETVFNNAY